MELTDGEITLRRPTEADAPAVAAAVQASIDELKSWMPWATDEFDEESALSWIRNEPDPGAEDYVVTDRSGELIGAAGLHPFDERDLRIELGYWIRSDRTGEGVATRAIRLLARHAIERRGAHRVELVISVENGASGRAAEKAGAVREGVLRERMLLLGRHHDAHIWSILPTDLALTS